MTVAPAGPRLRVVFVDHVARLSGGEIALLRLLPELRKHAEIHVILGEDGPLAARLHELAISVAILPMPSRLRDVRREATRVGRLDPGAVALLPGYVHRLSRQLRALDADIVHTNTLKAALYGGLAARIAGVPAVWHIRDRIAPDYLPRAMVMLVRGTARVLPSALVANSQVTRATLPRLRREVSVIPDTVEPPPLIARQPRDTFSVGVLGRLARWKGQHVFLAAFAEAFGGTTVRGRVVGGALFGEDDYAHELRQQASDLGVAQQIEFRGFREDIWAELAELDVLVHCSVVAEPFGQVVLEGMAAGLPVIAADAGGPAELITNGSDGLLTAPGDAHQLAAALARLREDTELRTALGSAAQQRSTAFTPESVIAPLMALYRAVVTR